MADEHKVILLVADDDPEIRSLLVVRLKKAGYQVLEAEDGVQALAQIRQFHPEMVLLDVMMPGKNGWEVAKEIRHDPRLKDTAIIMLTAIGEKINEMTSPLYGADAYVDKPFEFAMLELKIASILAQKKSAS